MPRQAPTFARAGLTSKASSPCSSTLPVELAPLVQCLASAASKGQQIALVCEPTLEGVLAATGLGYLAHVQEGQIRLVSSACPQLRLGESDIRLAASDAAAILAQRVWSGFAGRQGPGKTMAWRIVLACASDDPHMPEIVHRYVRLGFSAGQRLKDMIADPNVSALNNLARFVCNECEHTRQFVRFSHMSDGSWWALFRPKADTIPLTCQYFATRMGSERFCLVDPGHLCAALYDGERSSSCAVVRLDQRTAEGLATREDYADDERQMQAMWQRYYASMQLPGRDKTHRGYDLRAHWMPKRFWAELPELSLKP